jgi:hypothetical protein
MAASRQTLACSEELPEPRWLNVMTNAPREALSNRSESRTFGSVVRLSQAGVLGAWLRTSSRVI